MPELNWIIEISEQKLKKLIEQDEDLSFLHEGLGTEKFLLLWSYSQKYPINFSGRILSELKKEYVRVNPCGLNNKQLARKLDCTPQFVRNVKK